ncbi:MAG: hypothetical protein IPN33_24890 [Saprospiraceae bacterium]|nr:hypothetical protein [Saprospiraceae bacterium]
MLEAEWKDIPVVYAFLDPTDSVHYVRVEKAFLQQGGDAREIAQIADSLYYDNATVQLQKVGSSQLYTLEKVDGNLEGFPREGGVFATAPNYLYKIRQSNINLVGGNEVRFILNRGDDLPPSPPKSYCSIPSRPCKTNRQTPSTSVPTNAPSTYRLIRAPTPNCSTFAG